MSSHLRLASTQNRFTARSRNWKQPRVSDPIHPSKYLNKKIRKHSKESKLPRSGFMSILHASCYSNLTYLMSFIYFHIHLVWGTFIIWQHSNFYVLILLFHSDQNSVLLCILCMLALLLFYTLLGIHMFLDLQDPDPLVRGPEPDPDPDPFIIKQK